MKNLIIIVMLMLFTTFAYEVNGQSLAVTQHAISSVTGKSFNNTSNSNTSNIAAKIADANQQRAVRNMIIQSNRVFDNHGVFERQLNQNVINYKPIKLQTYKVKDIYNSKRTLYVYPTYKVDKK